MLSKYKLNQLYFKDTQEDTPEYKIGFYAFDCYHM